MWVVMIISGFVADILRTKHILQTTNVRKVFNGIGTILFVSLFLDLSLSNNQ